MRHVGKVQASIAFLVIAGFFGCIWMVRAGEVHSSMRDALLLLIGSLGAAFGAIVNYYFGSSLGSARKDERRTP